MPGRNLIAGFEGRGLAEVRNRNAWLNRIVRAQVKSVNPNSGQVTVAFDSTGGTRTILIPLGWMSINGAQSAWCRYMPQAGDFINVGFDTNGTAHFVSYDTLNYAQLEDLKADGSLPQYQVLKPGEFDMSSSGGAYIKGTQAGVLQLAGGAVDLQLNRGELRANMVTPLWNVQGDSGGMRFGDVKRFVLPSDQAESAISTPGSPVAYKEFRASVEQNLGGLDTVPHALLHLGQIIDELSFLEEVNLSTGLAYRARMRVYNGLPSLGGSLPVWSMDVDAGGNMGIAAGLAGTGAGFSLTSTAGPLDLSFLDATVNAANSISLNAVVDADTAAGTRASLNGGAQTVLGGTTGVHSAAFGDVLVSILAAFCTAVTSASAGAGAVPAQNGVAIAAIGAAATALQSTLSSILSTNVFIDR